MKTEIKSHWENVYKTKNPSEVSWTQDIPKTSLDLILSMKPEKSAAIIDIGGGDSNLVDHLLVEGFENITVLDISKKALEKSQKRLGKNADKVTWVVSDIIEFKPTKQYDIWHDRATFHFLTDLKDIKSYLNILNKALSGFLIIATFSDKGPKKCSGLAINQYSASSLARTFNEDFDKLACLTEDHTTPFDTVQNFLFCTFKRKNLR